MEVARELNNAGCKVQRNDFLFVYTVDTYKSVHYKSLRFAIFWEIFEIVN